MKREKESRENSVEKLVTRDLVPQILQRVATVDGVSGLLEFQVVAPNASSVSFVIFDQHVQNVERLKQDFTYFSPSFSRFFPRLQAGGRSCKRAIMLVTLTALSPEILFVNLVEVHKQFQRRGIGRTFQQTLLHSAGEYGYRFASATHENTQALQFFLQHGWFHYTELRAEQKPLLQCVLQTVALEDRGSTHFSVGLLSGQEIADCIEAPVLQQTLGERLEKFSRKSNQSPVSQTR